MGDTSTAPQTTGAAELRLLAQDYSNALYGPDGRVCVPRPTELELRAEIGRLTQAIRKAEQEGRR